MAGCSGQDGDDEGILFEMNWMHLLPERWLRPAGTARTGPAPTIAEGGPFRVHTLVTSLCRRAVWGLRGGWGVVVVVAGREAQSSLVSQPCQPHHLAASTTLSASSASRSPEQRLPYPGPCFTTTTSPRLAVCIVDASTPLSISAHGFANRSTDDIEEGGKDASTRSLSRWACQERVVMPCSLIFTLTLHVREAHSSPSPLLPPSPPSVRDAGHRKVEGSASQSEGSTRPSRQPHRHTPTASMIFSRSKCGHTTRRRWRRHTHTHRIAPPLPFAAPCLLPPSFPQDGMEARDWEA